MIPAAKEIVPAVVKKTTINKLSTNAPACCRGIFLEILNFLDKIFKDWQNNLQLGCYNKRQNL